MARKRARLTGVGDLREAVYNPRVISPEALGGLKRSMAEFGDLSGIVWNERTGNLVSGHQRVRALREEWGDKLELVDGVLVSPGGRWPIRVVDWDEAREKAANVVANSPFLAGEFAHGALRDVLAELTAPGFLADGLFESLRLTDLHAPLFGGENFDPQEGLVTGPNWSRHISLSFAPGGGFDEGLATIIALVESHPEWKASVKAK